MPVSTANVNPQAIVLTPMRVTYKGVDLGGTTDHVKVNIKYELADIMVDQYGKTSLNKKVSGHAFKVDFVLAEVADKSKWKVAFPFSHLITSGPNTAEYFDIQIGNDLLSQAGVLTLHPLSQVDADLSQDYTFWKAASISASEVNYGPDKQVGLKVEMVIFPDTSASPAKFMTYGDPGIGIVNAIAAAAVAGANTGNGTIGTEVAYNGYTRTETITVKCVGASSGNDFYVSGSSSGPLGEFHIASAAASTANFVCPQVSFTMTQGSTQFAYNDSFTIATTSANYA